MAFDLSNALPYLSPALSPEDTAPFHVHGSEDAPIARTFSKSLIVNYVFDEPGALALDGAPSARWLAPPSSALAPHGAPSARWLAPPSSALVFIRERDVRPSLRDDLHLCAIDNLRRRLALHAPRFERCEAKGDTHHAKWDGHHEASLLLLDELWDHRGRDLVAAVPARNKLVFAETKNAIAELRSHMERTSLSSELFGRRDRAWHPL